MVRQDSFVNGLIAALTFTFLSYWFLAGIEYLLLSYGKSISDSMGWDKLSYYFGQFDGFSEKTHYVMSLAGNVIPAGIFERQARGYSIRGLVLTVLVMLFGVIFYFWGDFVGAS